VGKKRQRSDVEEIRSIPSDVVLAPQAEAPRQPANRERPRPSKVRELSWAEFDRLVQRLAKEIGPSFRPQAVVGVAHGGVFVGGALASALGVDFFPVRISRRSRDREGPARPQLTGQMPKELRGKRVLVVDDIASSGDTLELAHALLTRVGVGAMASAVMVRREGGYDPDWSALQSDALVIFPWDYDMAFPEAFPASLKEPAAPKAKKGPGARKSGRSLLGRFRTSKKRG
jgi:uncharacterized protein